MKRPQLTVIVPVGPNRKLHALESLKAQEEPVVVLVEQGTNTSKNRNQGAFKAETELIAFIDAHTILPSNWSKKLIDFFLENPQVDIVGGPQLTPSNESYFGKVSGYALSSLFGAAEVSTRYKPKEFTLNADEMSLTSANLACRKKVFEKIQFNEDIYPGEDPKFIEDAKNENLSVAYNPQMIAYHKRRDNIKDLAVQIFKYGLMRPRKEKLTQTIKKPSFLVPSVFLIYLSLFSILSLLHPIFLFPLLLYVFLSLSFSLVEGLKSRDFIAFSILPFLFFTIHVSYGLGFLYGTISK